MRAKQGSYLLSKVKTQVWGPETKDAETLNTLAEKVTDQFSDCLISINKDNHGHLKNFIFSDSVIYEIIILRF